ncbi:metalloregulator ArsR/SmtB family transcription factor [Paracrocinitomix mangrovi]|uniref:ArsR/SmtB family transcription factor n=1 Tax=Paracrocinitomix mangrovi TaxID=2862509 RepID=UPI001C8E61EB|nr:metalloregulator ArsR/SmtB family transcription factor [Paracrocinitomix mangrovi]UKN01209.1 metalloregulator ArsR/SmtB family transcription factor [Paracrocinitomix mangrovi]
MGALKRDVFQGLADPTRREILTLIVHEPMSLNSIAEKFEISRPAVSQHIKILEECQLIDITQKGRQRFCEPKLDKLNEVAEWIAPFKEMWESRFNQLDNLLEELKTKSK